MDKRDRDTLLKKIEKNLCEAMINLHEFQVRLGKNKIQELDQAVEYGDLTLKLFREARTIAKLPPE